jgi:Cys-tRNA(Pro)/Cys-tRNA(Cys) deacylase
MHKTNAMRLLDARGIAYTPVQYSPAIHSGDEVARVIGEPAGRVFKTLVVLREPDGWLLVMVPSDRDLCLKKLAAAVGAKRVRMATRREAEAKTGLLVGGISALALVGKPFAVYLDLHALNWESIFISAGQRGYNLRMPVDDLMVATGAELIDAVDEQP